MRRWLRLTLVVALFVVAPAWPAAAQVAFDGEAVVTDTGGIVTTITLAAKTTAGSNRYGVAACAVSIPANVLGATWNGVTMGSPLVSATNGTDGRGVVIFGIINPPTAASDVVIDANSGGGVTRVCVAKSYNGVDQSTPAGTTNSASGTADPATVDCAAPAAGDMLVDMLYLLNAGTPPSVGAGQTQELNTDQGTWFGASSRQPGSSGATMSWTLTAPTRWTTACATLKAVAAAGAPKTQNLLGCCEATR